MRRRVFARCAYVSCRKITLRGDGGNADASCWLTFMQVSESSRSEEEGRRCVMCRRQQASSLTRYPNVNFMSWSGVSRDLGCEIFYHIMIGVASSRPSGASQSREGLGELVNAAIRRPAVGRGLTISRGPRRAGECCHPSSSRRSGPHNLERASASW